MDTGIRVQTSLVAGWVVNGALRVAPPAYPAPSDAGTKVSGHSLRDAARASASRRRSDAIDVSSVR
jgi:hypothetical protein